MTAKEMSEAFRDIALRLHSAGLRGDWGEIARLRVACEQMACSLENRVENKKPCDTPSEHGYACHCDDEDDDNDDDDSPGLRNEVNE